MNVEFFLMQYFFMLGSPKIRTFKAVLWARE